MHEINAAALLTRINNIHDFRITQIADGKKFQQQYNKFVSAYRRLTRQGQQRQFSLPTPQEQALLDRQQHYAFSDMAKEEQQQLQAEVDSMWGQIPQHLQDKAKTLAGIN